MAKKFTPKNASQGDEGGGDDFTPPEIFSVDFASITGDGDTTAAQALRGHYAEMVADATFVELRTAVEGGTASLAQSTQYAGLVERANEAAMTISSLESQSTSLDDLPEAGGVEDTSFVPVEGGGTDPADGDIPDEVEDPDGGEDAPDASLTPEVVSAAMGLLAAGGLQAAGGAGVQSGVTDGNQPKGEIAPLVSSVTVMTAGTDGATETLTAGGMTDTDWSGAVASLRNAEAGERVSLGGWRVWDATPEQTLPQDMNGTVVASITNRDVASGARRMDPKTAAPCAPGCIRLDIRDCGNNADPLNIFTEYPCDRGTVTWFRGYTMRDIDGSVTVWDPAKQAAFDAAYEAYNTALDSGSTDDIANALAAVKQCEKRCAMVKCLTRRPRPFSRSSSV